MFGGKPYVTSHLLSQLAANSASGEPLGGSGPVYSTHSLPGTLVGGPVQVQVSVVSPGAMQHAPPENPARVQVIPQWLAQFHTMGGFGGTPPHVHDAGLHPGPPNIEPGSPQLQSPPTSHSSPGSNTPFPQ